MNILINLLIFLIVLFLYLHIIFQLKKNNDLEILEINEPTKEQLEEICDLRQPVIFNFNKNIEHLNIDNLLKDYSAFDINIRNNKDNENDSELYLPLSLKEANLLLEKDISNVYISENNKDFLDETSNIKYLNNNDIFLRPSFVSYCYYDLFLGNTNSYTPFRYDIYYRNYIFVNEGSITIRLTPPKNDKYLNVIKDYEMFEFKSDIDIWNVQNKYQNDFDKIKCLDVELKSGQIIYIPAYWFYSIKYNKKSVLCNFKYTTFTNNIAILPEYIMHILQHTNTKRKITECTKFINSNIIDFNKN